MRGSGERPREFYTDAPVVANPCHGGEYSLETGARLGDDDYVLRAYDVVVRDRTVYGSSG